MVDASGKVWASFSQNDQKTANSVAAFIGPKLQPPVAMVAVTTGAPGAEITRTPVVAAVNPTAGPAPLISAADGSSLTLSGGATTGGLPLGTSSLLPNTSGTTADSMVAWNAAGTDFLQQLGLTALFSTASNPFSNVMVLDNGVSPPIYLSMPQPQGTSLFSMPANFSTALTLPAGLSSGNNVSPNGSLIFVPQAGGNVTLPNGVTVTVPPASGNVPAAFLNMLAAQTTGPAVSTPTSAQATQPVGASATTPAAGQATGMPPLTFLTTPGAADANATTMITFNFSADALNYLNSPHSGGIQTVDATGRPSTVPVNQIFAAPAPEPTSATTSSTPAVPTAVAPAQQLPVVIVPGSTMTQNVVLQSPTDPTSVSAGSQIWVSQDNTAQMPTSASSLPDHTLARQDNAFSYTSTEGFTGLFGSSTAFDISTITSSIPAANPGKPEYTAYWQSNSSAGPNVGLVFKTADVESGKVNPYDATSVFTYFLNGGKYYKIVSLDGSMAHAQVDQFPVESFTPMAAQLHTQSNAVQGSTGNKKGVPGQAMEQPIANGQLTGWLAGVHNNDVGMQFELLPLGKFYSSIGGVITSALNMGNLVKLNWAGERFYQGKLGLAVGGQGQAFAMPIGEGPSTGQPSLGAGHLRRRVWV